MTIYKKPTYLGLLYISAFLIFIGRALQLLVWEAPLRAFFWDEETLKPIVENIFGWEWLAYTKSSAVNIWIDRLNIFLGLVLLSAAISTLLLWIKKPKKIYKVLMWLGIGVVGIILILEYKERFYHFAQFLEGFTQFFAPILLLMFINQKINLNQLDKSLRLIVALTFVGHGLYAIDFYATPGYFIDMVITLLGVSEDMAKQLLWIVGWIDISLILLLFIPFTQKAALYYAIIWGFLTALARYVFHLKIMGLDYHVFNSLHLTLYRLPHGLVPLAILYIINYYRKNSSNEII